MRQSKSNDGARRQGNVRSGASRVAPVPGQPVQSKPGVHCGPPPDDALFGRVASILEHARTNVVRAVNHNMVVAYWLIGREIVMELQRGQERAGYGEGIVLDLPRRLTAAYGKGYSVENLLLFKKFYSVYAPTDPILYPMGTELQQPEIIEGSSEQFASRYVTCLPTEAELAAEIQRTRALIEGRGAQR